MSSSGAYVHIPAHRNTHMHDHTHTSQHSLDEEEQTEPNQGNEWGPMRHEAVRCGTSGKSELEGDRPRGEGRAGS